MKIVQATLSLTLAISGLLGIQILIDDKWLWAAAPSHAYGLIGFVSIDMILVVVALVRVGLATVSAALMAVAQFAAMLADVVVANQKAFHPSPSETIFSGTPHTWVCYSSRLRY